MDKIEIKDLLESKISKKIIFLPEFYSDFADLLHNNGSEDKVIATFVRKILMMQQLNCNSGLKWLEKIKFNDNMYSLHIDVGSLNYRALFSLSNDNRVFLHVFYEQSGKKNTSYESHLPIAAKRMKEYLKGDKRQ